MTTSRNNEGFIYQIEPDPMGTFIEVYRTNKDGEQTDLWISIYVNTPEGETPQAAFESAKAELDDPIFLSEANIKGVELERQRTALDWLINAYDSIQDIKDNA